MEIVHPEVDRYLARLSAPDDPVLRDMESLARKRRFPIVGPQVGRLLQALAMACGARRVLELGSGFGYSALWFARAVGPRGLVILTEGSAERAGEAERFLDRAGLAGRVRIEIGDALKVAARLRGRFDVVFNDVDKHQYPDVLPLAAAKLRPGGLLITDNLLWAGRVVRKGRPDPETRGILRLTRALYETEGFFSALVPLRDGVGISVRLPRAPRSR